MVIFHTPKPWLAEIFPSTSLSKQRILPRNRDVLRISRLLAVLRVHARSLAALPCTRSLASASPPLRPQHSCDCIVPCPAHCLTARAPRSTPVMSWVFRTGAYACTRCTSLPRVRMHQAVGWTDGYAGWTAEEECEDVCRHPSSMEDQAGHRQEAACA